MGFAEKYLHALNASNLQDDEHHHLTDALCAAAIADETGASLGSLLARVKFADGTPRQMFEAGTANLAQLLRVWRAMVQQKGMERKWIKLTAAWDVQAAIALFDRVAEQSLAHWMDGRCSECKGASQTPDRRLCPCCKGTGKADLPTGGFERERVLDMVTELESYLQSHNARAAKRLRREL